MLSEIVVSPWFTLGGGATYDRVAVDEHVDGSEVPPEVAGIGIGLGQFGRAHFGILLCCRRRPVAQPFHELE